MQARAIAALFAVALGISACACYDDFSQSAEHRSVTSGARAG